jgi:Zn-dependent protease
MRDPFSWSFPLGRLFGITIRVHFFFPVVAAGLVLRTAFKDNPANPPGYWIEACWLVGVLFFSVLLHELGHCFAARMVEGDAHEILLWPLGGLASVEVPHTPRAHFVATAGGPGMNLLLCAAAAVPLLAWGFYVPELFNPLYDVYALKIFNWKTQTTFAGPYCPGDLTVLGPWEILPILVFWVNWILALLNLVLGFPMDFGRLLQAMLWPRFGYQKALMVSISWGIISSILVAIYAMVYSDMLFVFLCLFIFFTCRAHILQSGGEESLFGYDFSQGYTSLERDQPPRRRRPNVWQRWQMRRAARKLQREMEQRESEERRMDELLEKVQRQGLQALTEEERRFLTRVSAKYRNRQ